MGELNRGERLQISMPTYYDSRQSTTGGSNTRMPNSASAVRELLKRGLAAKDFDLANQGAKSKDFGVVTEEPAGKVAGRAGKSNGRESAGK